jgi:hypothetical protein
MKEQGGGPVLQVFAGDFNIIKHSGDNEQFKKSFLNVVFNDVLVTRRKLLANFSESNPPLPLIQDEILAVL